MDAALPAAWLERVAESLCAHEERRDTLQSFPPRYEVLEELSRGGMGIVYRAWDPQLGRNVALKVLRAEDGAAAEAHERFQREARLAASLHHPHIVPVYDSGTWNGQDYIAMQLLEGESLAHATLDRRTALTHVRDAARALHFAHGQGIVHRDIKPSNLLLDAADRVYVADFGVARQSVATSSMTTPGTVVGTPAYMSPEQALGLPADARSDVYSLGATLYELLAGRPPFDGEPMAVIEAVRTRDAEPARRIVPDLSRNVEAILAGAMERRPEDRYASAAALADDIDRYLAGERPLRRPRGLSYRVQREFVRHPWRSGAAIVLGLLLVMAGILLGYFLRAWTYREWAKSMSDRDPDKIPYLTIAAPFFRDAEDELIRLRAEKAVADLPKPEPEKPRREPTPDLQPKEPEKPTPDTSRQTDPVAKAVTSIESQLDREQLDAAAQGIEELASTAPDRAAELRPKLRKKRFESGVQKLREALRRTGVTDFDALFMKLLDPAYAEQKGASSVLGPLALQRALALAEAKKWKDAVMWFDQGEKLGFKESRLFEQRGLALLELLDWSRAEQDLQSLRGYSKTVPAAFAALPYRKEHQALLDRRWAEAMIQADAVFLIDPRHAAAIHDRGLARFGGSGRAREALEGDLKEAMKIDSSLLPSAAYRDVLLSYAHDEVESHWKADDPKERDAAWRELLGWLDLFLKRVLPKDPDLLAERARTRRRMGDLLAALDDAREALAIRPDADAHLLFGILTFLQGRIPKPDDARTRDAIGSFDEAARLRPDDYRPLYWRGLCRRDLGGKELDPALRDLAEASKLHPGSPFLDLQLASARVDVMFRDINNKDWKEAVSDAARAVMTAENLSQEDFVAGFYELRRLSRAQALKLHLKDAHLCRAQAFNQGADFARSIEECSAAIQVDPDYRLGYLWRGFAQFSSRNYKEAQEDFRMALKLSKEGERKTAEEWLNRAVKLSRGN
jgi:serine/threonine protein kinase